MCPEPDLYLEQIFGFKTNSFELGLKLIVSKQYLIFSFRLLEFVMTIFSILITFLLSLLSLLNNLYDFIQKSFKSIS